MIGKIRIVWADDHKIVREGVSSLLAEDAALEIVAEAEDGRSALEWIQSRQPDVLLLDLALPDQPGLDVIRQARQVAPATQVVVLSVHADEAVVAAALQAGAVGYVFKGASAQELRDAIHAAAQGKRYLSAPLWNHLLDAYLHRAAEVEKDPLQTLSTRERTVWALIAEGKTNNAIAYQLSLSLRTVERDRARLMQKLAVNSVAELVRYAVQRGIVDDREK